MERVVKRGRHREGSAPQLLLGALEAGAHAYHHYHHSPAAPVNADPDSTDAKEPPDAAGEEEAQARRWERVADERVKPRPPTDHPLSGVFEVPAERRGVTGDGGGSAPVCRLGRHQERGNGDHG